jgi:hypothetical protein
VKYEHDFSIYSDYPNKSPSGRLWAGHYYRCEVCGIEVGHPSHLTEDERECDA